MSSNLTQQFSWQDNSETQCEKNYKQQELGFKTFIYHIKSRMWQAIPYYIAYITGQHTTLNTNLCFTHNNYENSTDFS